MFPDDSRIPIDYLVMYMMGLKLFAYVDDMFAARCRVNHLISIINDLKYPRNAIPISHGIDGLNNQCFNMLVGARNLAKMIPLSCHFVFGLETVQQKWPDLRSYKDFFGLSLVFKRLEDNSSYLECPKLALLQLQYREDSKVILAEFFEGMKGLRILSLDVPSLPRSLGVPLNLITLVLKVMKLEDMSWIGSLTNLEFLSISSSSLISIPREMGNLEKLRLLDLKKVKLACIPPGVFSRMLKLEELYLPISFGSWGCSIKQLDDSDEAEFSDEDDVEKINNVIDDA